MNKIHLNIQNLSRAKCYIKTETEKNPIPHTYILNNLDVHLWQVTDIVDLNGENYGNTRYRTLPGYS